MSGNPTIFHYAARNVSIVVCHQLEVISCIDECDIILNKRKGSMKKLETLGQAKKV